MARFKIYSKDGQTLRYEGCPRYNGTYLKVSYLEFSSVASPTPIAWQVGDYVDYPRTGLRYTLRSIPAVKKTAKSGQTGNAFVYQNVRFMAQTQDLSVAPFIDLVPEDNGVHFSTQSAVSTFENAYGIAARIQACLDDLFPGVWDVEVYENLDDDFKAKISEAVDFSIDGGTCLEACDRMYETWGIGWTHYKDSATGKEVLLFGRPNTRTSENTSAEFVFGPGEGLTAIKRSVANADEIGTRLRVFGSSRNMVSGYYNGLGIYNAESVDIQNLMIPLSKWGKTAGKPDARKAFLQASADAVEALGLIPRTHYFDGSDGEEIYPSLEGVTIGNIRDAKEESGDTYYVPKIEIYPSDSERADEVKAVTNPEDDGYSGGSDGSKYKDTKIVSFSGLNRDAVRTLYGVTKRYTIFSGVNFSGDWPAVTVETGMEGYIDDSDGFIRSISLKLRLVTEEDTQYEQSSVVEVPTEIENNGTRFRFTLPEITLVRLYNTPVSLHLDMVINVDPPSSQTDVRTFYVTLSGYDFTLGQTSPVAGDFPLTLKQIGFDIAQRASFTSDGLARVFIKDGMNAGRSFYVKSCSFDASGDQWILGMYRAEDESTGMKYPNSLYPIKPGDHFVLLDLAMPEIYIGMASQRLYEKGLEMLKDISRIKPYYEPEVDAIVMTEQSRVLREGMYMRLSDADVSGPSSEYVLIDTLTINEGDAEIPTYKVGLREYKKKTFQETTNAAIDSISQKVSGKGSSATSVPPMAASYGSLSDKPSIDGVTLNGSMSSYDDIGLLNKTHFSLENIGTEEKPVFALRTKYGVISESFISAHGSDPDAGGGEPGEEKPGYLPLTGGTVSGSLTVKGGLTTETGLSISGQQGSGRVDLKDNGDVRIRGVREKKRMKVMTGRAIPLQPMAGDVYYTNCVKITAKDAERLGSVDISGWSGTRRAVNSRRRTLAVNVPDSLTPDFFDTTEEATGVCTVYIYIGATAADFRTAAQFWHVRDYRADGRRVISSSDLFSDQDMISSPDVATSSPCVRVSCGLKYVTKPVMRPTLVNGSKFRLTDYMPEDGYGKKVRYRALYNRAPAKRKHAEQPFLHHRPAVRITYNPDIVDETGKRRNGVTYLLGLGKKNYRKVHLRIYARHRNLWYLLLETTFKGGAVKLI